MSTKEPRCKIPEGKQPPRRAYERQCEDCRPLRHKLKKLFQRTRGDEPLPPPHEWPPYGADCWRQAYEEATALRLVAETYAALLSAQKSAYMPAYILAMYLANFNNAKTVYVAAWGAMEDCLTTIV
jgi:hypothetical protein